MTVLSLALSPSSSAATERYGVDLNGRPVSDLGGPGIHFIVLIFAATDCPISNRYVPEIARLNKEFSPQGVRFWWVFPNPSDHAHLVSKHNKEFAIRENSLLDVSQAMVHRANATVTPEAAVFTAGMREVYHGRIDDRYLDMKVAALSGGNQQKALIGRVLLSGARRLVLFDPTRGVDVGTKQVIYSVIRRFAEGGGSVLIYSTELSELVHLADRCLALYRGAVSGELSGAALSESALLALATGHVLEAAE